MTTNTDLQTESLTDKRPPDPIPGYKLLERIGSGGYGEVWRASAPGNLTKAIKLVYGQLDDNCAARELKALNRIKEVRHPFLLSLERIEVSDGQLVVVSELADGSLRDVFQQCQQAGMPGVPDEQLLAFLKDAADALDYLCDDHRLQHLDIKPENLLLVGGRVKVADFGMVKELFNASKSMMGGLTPIYAPPEVFDGAPGPQSDQYSLAIVFQELLTGTLPFSGRTAAQLAAQHLHSRPRLESIPQTQRPALNKALAKDPAKRFSNCCELIEELAGGRRTNIARPRSSALPTAPIEHNRPTTVGAPQSKTIPLDGRKLAEELSRHGGHRPIVEMETLSPIDFSESEFRCRPTLFLGIGGTAGVALQGLKSRLSERFGDASEIPAFQMLLLDTDRQALAKSMEKSQRGALELRETLALPLRKSEEYRQIADRFLSWMSRRWIYNVPRSLATEGMRPIGRLALADHTDVVRQRLQSMLTAACDPDGVTTSAEKTGLKFDGGSPRIYVVASVSGGAGGGVVLDLAYLMRQVLAEHGFNDDSVVGVLAHSTERKSNRRDLAVANAVACLKELHHYDQPTGVYPGDPANGVATYHGATFSQVYLAHLGKDLATDDWLEAAKQLAEYTYRSAVTPAARFFETCRSQENQANEQDLREMHIRSFGVNQIGCSVSEIPDTCANRLCQRMIQEWRGELKVSAEEQPKKFYEQSAPLDGNALRDLSIDASTERLASEHAQRLGLEAKQLCALALQTAESELGITPDQFFDQLLANFLSRRGGSDPASSMAADLLQSLDSLLGTGDSAPPDNFVPLRSAVEKHIDELVDQRANMLEEWIYQLADTSRTRLHGARRAAQWFVRQLESHVQDISSMVETMENDCKHLKLAMAPPSDAVNLQHSKPLDQKQIEIAARQYFHLRFEQIARRVAYRIARRLAQVKLALISDHIRDLIRELGQIVGVFETPDDPAPALGHQDQQPINELHASAQQSLARRLPELAAQLESEMSGEKNCLQSLLTGSLSTNNEFVERMRSTARRLIQRSLKAVKTVDSIMPSVEKDGARNLLDAAAPSWTSCGGSKRLLVIMPDDGDASGAKDRLRGLVGQPFNLMSDADNDLVFCYEAEGIPLKEVVREIMEGRHDLAKVADRLHTRIDVDWTSL
jgi:serine/threonine protein kinase